MYYRDQAEQLRNMVKQNSRVGTTNAKVYTITSGKGGVGKSNTAVNLAVQFRKRGKRVIIFDADFGLANVEVMFGMVPSYSLKDVIFGDRRISEVITEGPMGIGFVSGGSGIVGLNNLEHDQVDVLIRSLSELGDMADVLLIDTGAGVGANVMDFVLASPEVILVSTPEPSSLMDSYSLVKALHHHPQFERKDTHIRLLTNRVTSKEEADAIYGKFQSIVKKFLQGDLTHLGLIWQDSLLEKAVREQRVVSLAYPHSKSAKAYEEIAGRILDGDTSEQQEWGIAGFFRRFIQQRLQE